MRGMEKREREGGAENKTKTKKQKRNIHNTKVHICSIGKKTKTKKELSHYKSVWGKERKKINNIKKERSQYKSTYLAVKMQYIY